MANQQFSKGLPSALGAPAFVNEWRRRALIAGLIFEAIAVILAFLDRRRINWGGSICCADGWRVI